MGFKTLRENSVFIIVAHDRLSRKNIHGANRLKYKTINYKTNFLYSSLVNVIRRFVRVSSQLYH